MCLKLAIGMMVMMQVLPQNVSKEHLCRGWELVPGKTVTELTVLAPSLSLSDGPFAESDLGFSVRPSA